MGRGGISKTVLEWLYMWVLVGIIRILDLSLCEKLEPKARDTMLYIKIFMDARESEASQFTCLSVIFYGTCH